MIAVVTSIGKAEKPIGSELMFDVESYLPQLD